MDRPSRHIVFVGSMGAGKSHAARALAERLGRPLLDNDEQFVAAQGLTGREASIRSGVVALQQAEAKHLLEALDSSEPSVIAAAASVVDGDRCLDALAAVDVVWLRASPETAARRMGERSHRRSLGPDATEALAALADRRAPRYQHVADLIIDTDELKPSEVVEQVLAWLDTAQDDPQDDLAQP